VAEAVNRRLELLKLEGLGFSQPEIVKELSQKFACSGRTVYRDFECRDRWQSDLQHLENHGRILMKVVNRYEQIYRQASIKLLTGSLQANRNRVRIRHYNGQLPDLPEKKVKRKTMNLWRKKGTNKY
jgi:hypothetical protein